MSRLTISFVDYNREPSATGINVTQLSGTYAGWREDINDLADAIKDVSIALPTKTVFLAEVEGHAAPNAAATSPQAQRERKWLVRYYDNVNFKPGSFEIPGANLSLLRANSDFMDISSGPGFFLVSALENNMLSVDGNAVVVTSVEHVGRNI